MLLRCVRAEATAEPCHMTTAFGFSYPSPEGFLRLTRENLFDLEKITAALSEAGYETDVLFTPFEYQRQDSGKMMTTCNLLW